MQKLLIVLGLLLTGSLLTPALATNATVLHSATPVFKNSPETTSGTTDYRPKKKKTKKKKKGGHKCEAY